MFDISDVWQPLYQEWSNRHQRPIRISHYTNRDAFFAIIGSRQLRATNLWDILNQDEITYGYSLVVEAINGGRARATGAAGEFLENLHGDPLRSLTCGQNAYISCFCADSDDTDMWETQFADKGRGWELAFYSGRRVLSGLAPALQPSGVVSRTVEYDGGTQRWWLNRCVDSLVSSLNASANEEDRRATQQFFFQSLIECLTCFKPQSYSVEKEHRLIYWNPPPASIVSGVDNRRHVYLPISLRSSKTEYWDYDKDCLIELVDVVKGPMANLPTIPESRLLRVVYPGSNRMFRPSTPS